MSLTAANISVRLLAHPIRGGFSFLLLMALLLAMQQVAAQTDSTQVSPPDSTISPPPAGFQPGKRPAPGDSTLILSPPPLQIDKRDAMLFGPAKTDSSLTAATDSTLSAPKKEKKKIQINLIRYYVKDDKPRMEINLPWRTLDYPSIWAFSSDHDPSYNPKVASSRGMLIPGWGQYYNRSYWKLPIVYGGPGAFACLFSYNNSQSQTLRQAYIFRTDNNPATVDNRFSPNIPDSGILSARDQARRNRDFTIVVAGGWWALSIIEAFVDTHLKTFDVSEDLTFQMKPSLIRPLPGSSATVGAGFTLGF
mgnify:CR=1 FL=1